MKVKLRVLATMLILICCGLCSAAVETSHWDLQEVKSDGDTNNPDVGEATKFIVEGIVLNRPQNMANLNEEWQMYVQGEGDDHAGTAVYMRKYNYPTNQGYTLEKWQSELYRISHDPNGNYEFQPGDRVRVTGKTWFYKGKANINEQHQTGDDYNFIIDLIDPAAGLPEPNVITLNMVKNSTGRYDWNFDHNREEGCELYQAQLVRVNDVNIASGTWEPDESIFIKDSNGLEFEVKLGFGSGFSTYSAPTGQIDVIGIFDQEAIDYDYTTGYRIWVMNYDGNGLVLTDNCGLNGYHSGDINRDCVVDFTDFAELAANWLKCSNLSFNDCTEP